MALNESGPDPEDEELERQVDEMAKKVLEYRATLPVQLKNTVASILAVQPPVFLDGSGPGTSGAPNFDHSFTIKELLRLAELIQYCVANANLSDASLHTTRMHDYYSINTKVDDTYLQNVSRYKLPIILGLCSVPLYASGSLRPKFFGYFTFLDFLKLVCLWNARRFGNLAFSLRVYAATYPAIKVKIAMIESCMVEAQFWPAWFKICVATNFLVVCWEIHTAMVLEASFMILFWNSKAWVNKQRNPLHANLTT
nr:uncharacterized protein LOC114821659 [Malus domestica]